MSVSMSVSIIASEVSCSKCGGPWVGSQSRNSTCMSSIHKVVHTQFHNMKTQFEFAQLSGIGAGTCTCREWYGLCNGCSKHLLATNHTYAVAKRTYVGAADFCRS